MEEEYMKGKKGKRSQKKDYIIKYDSNGLSQEQMIEIQTEAYYRAIKRIENEKENKYKINRLCPDDADHVTWFQCLQQRRRRNGNLQRQDLETEPHNY